MTDYQIVLTALLYLCTERSGNVILLTCDKDLVDISENLVRSAIEKYTVNLILTEKLKRVNYNLKIFGGLKFLYTTEIFDELNSTCKKIKDSDLFWCFQVAYYDRSDGKLYGDINKLPIWLMDFFLEYKGNNDCYSAYKEIELKYPIKYVMDPTKSTKKIYFDLTMRKKPHYGGFMPNCEDRCIYARKESGNPLDLSCFV